jgi:hypothetical protein
MSFAKIVKDKIVVELPIRSLKVITRGGPYGNEIKITDSKIFAKELVRTLNDEEEDGTTAIHRMIDSAIFKAYENGAEGIEEVVDDYTGENK